MTSSIGPKHSGVPAPSATQRYEQLAPSRHARTGPLVFDELTSVAATSAKRAGPRLRLTALVCTLSEADERRRIPQKCDRRLFARIYGRAVGTDRFAVFFGIASAWSSQ
jgi:hypothetical protein